jgi:hypothetical protein
MRKTSPVIFALGVISGLAFVVTCDTPHISGGGNMNRDGSMMGIPDAHAQAMAMAVDCSQIQTFTETYAAANYTSTTDTYFADVAISGLDPTTAPHISVIVCQPTNYGTSACPGAPYMCTTTGTPLPSNLNCAPAPAYTLDAGRLVITCGSHTHSVSSGVANDYGIKYAKAYVRVN